MCIAVFMWQFHPRYPFLLMFNRDELHDRDTRSLSWWDEDGDCKVLAGKDNVRGGTWLGSNRNGKIAFLTNFRQFPNELLHFSKSRGFLPLRFLQCDLSPRQYAEEVAASASEYDGFNLILVDMSSNSIVYVTNGDSCTITDVVPGIHVLSNASLDTPWPKSLRLGKAAKEFIDKQHHGEEISVEEMAQALMNDTTKDEFSRLPGIFAPEWEQAASSVFVDLDTPFGRYGTLSTSGVSVTNNGGFTFYERYLHMGTWKQHTEQYQITPQPQL